MKGKSPLPPFGLDMGFDEALRRFVQTDPKELAENVATAKKGRRTEKVDDKRDDHSKETPLE